MFPPRATDELVDRIDALLPQTQCTQCGFTGCRPYATAIAEGRAPINRCPPGGQAGADRLADTLGRDRLTLDPSCGPPKPRHVAWIEPELCIGCTKCITACPLDAIIGASKRMHTVIDDWCSGCDLCVPACPVDCITMRPARAWTSDDADLARRRHHDRAGRLIREARENRERLAAMAVRKLDALEAEPDQPDAARKRAVIEAAIARARARLTQGTTR